MKRFIFVIVGLAAIAGFYEKRSWILSSLDLTINGPKTVDQRVEQYGETVNARLKPDFDKAGVDYPPGKVTLVVLKQERQMELYAKNRESTGAPSPYRFVRSYPILAESGHLGPKLRQGDWQVPEGTYAVESLNPNSHYHLALHVNYPNAFDRTQAEADGRSQLGGDIMIHGSDVSIGCVAMGDEAAEDLFVLTAQTGISQVRLLFCPYDFRVTKKPPEGPDFPAWTPKLYTDLEQTLNTLPPPTR